MLPLIACAFDISFNFFNEFVKFIKCLINFLNKIIFGVIYFNILIYLLQEMLGLLLKVIFCEPVIKQCYMVEVGFGLKKELNALQ